MMTVKVPLNTFVGRSSAKVNLSLAVTGKRGNLHTLDMIVVPYEKSEDVAIFSPSDDVTFRYGGYDGFDATRFDAFFRPKALELMKALDVTGRLSIHKWVPLGAGLGGSSAAIVAAARAMEAYCRRIGKSNALDAEFLCKLGSDVPVMYVGGVCRVKGVGEEVVSLNEKAPEFNVEIAPLCSDSGLCYKSFDEMGEICADAPPTNIEEALIACRNDLERAAFRVYPQLVGFKERLKEGHKIAILSGSGSAFVCID